MPIFLGIHEMDGGVTEDQLKEIWYNYQAAAQKHGAEAWKVYFNAEEGKAYCITEAKSKDDVDAAHTDLGMPTKETVEVQKLS